MVKALGMYIFGGSQTIGWMQSGFEVDTVLEMTDDMTECNAYHFTKNYPNINIVKPSYWKDHLDEYKCDVMFGNPPCSGLSSINRNASADSSTNDHIYEYVNAAMIIKPKVFFIENAPTLTKLGLPILKKIQDQVKDEYRLTIINDCAMNHNVAMHRRRTFVIGWRKDVFNKIPRIDANKQSMFTVEQALANLTGNESNMEFANDIENESFKRFYHYCNEGNSILGTLRDNFTYIKKDLTEDELKTVEKFIEKCNRKNSVWDKSSYRLPATGLAPSMASVVQFMHPTENRDLYVREYARLMGYPDDFIFYQDECKTPIVQCLAQGVPVNFIKYIATEIKANLESSRGLYDSDVVYINQTSGHQKVTEFTSAEFKASNDISKNIQEVSLF